MIILSIYITYVYMKFEVIYLARHKSIVNGIRHKNTNKIIKKSISA